MFDFNMAERVAVGTIGFVIGYLILLIVETEVPDFEFNWVGVAVGAYGYQLFDFMLFKIKNRG